MRKWCFTNDLRISIVTVAMATCRVNTNMKCNMNLSTSNTSFYPYLFSNNIDVHKTKNAPHPPPIKNVAFSP